MFHRIAKPLLSKSFFLFGARGTGKSTFLSRLFAEGAVWFDLLDPELEDELSRNPNSLKQRLMSGSSPDWVVIDEIQKVPKLLNIVHYLIENTDIKFALTGSSARKLKRGSANLLAGRAFVNHLFPLTYIELAESFDLDFCLNWGALPEIYSLTSDEERSEYLRSYALTYLKEEIWSEHVIRKMDPFRRFLEIAAQSNCEILNYANIARDVGVDIKTVQSYYEIMEDTLVGFLLPAYSGSVRKQQRKSPKFYFFDIGVKRALERGLTQQIVPSSYVYGKTFEHWVIAEIYRLNIYFRKDFKLSYLMTRDNCEVDLIIERPGDTTLLVEIKSKDNIDERSTKHLQRFVGDVANSKALVISRDTSSKYIDGIKCLHWREAFGYILGV